MSELDKCLKFKSIGGGGGDNNDCILCKITPPRNAINFRHLFNCDTIVSIFLLHKMAVVSWLPLFRLHTRQLVKSGGPGGRVFHRV